MQIPMDEQWITGSYSPDDFDINQRAFALTMVVKTTDKVLYNKMNYDKDDGAAWLAELEVKANAQTGANANVLWTATPISMRAGRQLTMAVTGTFIADPLAGDPITVELINAQTTQY
jgi:hypothetical protein